MQYDLELLEDLITVTLDPKKILLIQPSAAEIADYERLAQTEKIGIKKRMKSTTGKPVKEKYKEKYIQRNQQDIIELKNTLVNYLRPIDAKDLEINDSDDAVTGLYKLLFHTLKELLTYIEEYFYSYFNQDEKVPKSYLLRNIILLQTKERNLRKILTKNGYDPKLVKLALRPISKLSESEKSTVTYRQFLYIKRLLTELEGLNNHRNGNSSFNPLTDLLLYMNFNCGNFISCLIADIVDVINALPDQQQKTERLLKWCKEINQFSIKPGVALKPPCASSKEQLNFWIIEEIHYLETKQRLLSVAPVIKDEILSDEEKLHFSVSINVLSIFTKAAHDSALLLNKKGTIIFKNIAKYCRTIQASKLSAESMDKKSHVAERTRKEKAILVLQEMIKWVHKYCLLPFVSYHAFFNALDLFVNA